MLTVKFGPLPKSVPNTVHTASIDQIKAWAARAVTTETLGTAGACSPGGRFPITLGPATSLQQ